MTEIEVYLTLVQYVPCRYHINLTRSGHQYSVVIIVNSSGPGHTLGIKAWRLLLSPHPPSSSPDQCIIIQHPR